MTDEIEINLRLTNEQANYVKQYLYHPIIPTAKDLDVAYSIQDQLASAKQKAEQSALKRLKAQKIGKIIAKLIIGKSITGREWYHKDEIKNLMHSYTSCKFVKGEQNRVFYSLTIDEENLKEKRFLVTHDQSFDRLTVWVIKEGQLYPWLDPNNPEPFTTFSMDCIDDLLEKYRNV